MNGKIVKSVLKEALRANFGLEEIQQLRKMRNMGMLLDVFDDAIQEVIESIVADRFQLLELDE